MGRPIAFDREEVLEAAMETFWLRGFESTSLFDLIGAMGLSKSSFYQAFSSKHQLFLQCLRRYRKQLVHDLMARLTRAESGLGFLVDELYEIPKSSRGRVGSMGCLLMNTAAEFAQGDPDVAGIVKDGIDDLHAVFGNAIARAVEEGGLHSDRKPAELAQFLVTGMTGMKTMSQAGLSPDQLEAVARHTLHALGAADDFDVTQ